MDNVLSFLSLTVHIHSQLKVTFSFFFFSFLNKHTIPYQYQAGLVGSFSILQLEGVRALIRRGQRLHGHLNHTGVLVKVHLIFLPPQIKQQIFYFKTQVEDTSKISERRFSLTSP